MLTKKIKYTDVDGNTRVEEFRFNINKAELQELEFSMEGGFLHNLWSAMEHGDVPSIMRLTKILLEKSYGERSLDGRRFDKSEEINKNFFNTGAYDVLFCEIIYDPDKFLEFLRGVLPPVSDEELKEAMDKMANDPIGIISEA